MFKLIFELWHRLQGNADTASKGVPPLQYWDGRGTEEARNSRAWKASQYSLIGVTATGVPSPVLFCSSTRESCLHERPLAELALLLVNGSPGVNHAH